VSDAEIFSIGPCHGQNKTDCSDLKDDSYFPKTTSLIVSSKEKSDISLSSLSRCLLATFLLHNTSTQNIPLVTHQIRI